MNLPDLPFLPKTITCSKQSILYMHRNEKNILLGLLPEFQNSTCHVGGICYTVIGETAFCVPGIITVPPWKILIKKVGVGSGEKRIRTSAFYCPI